MSTKIRLLAVLVLVSSMFAAMIGGAFAHHDATEDYYPIETDEFEAVWERTDLPVHELIVARTWIWSPAAHTPLLVEEYAEGDGGVREVQYFDKSRMEMPTLGVADPGDEESPWFITQGLLATELMTGNLQLGDDTFEQHRPSQRSVAGDPGDTTSPTYAVMGEHMDTEARDTGELIVEFMDREGNITEDDRFADYGVTDAHFDEVTEHNIASVFWDFMNSQTIVYEDGEYVEDDLFLNPYYAVGRPHTEAYWAWVTVDRVEQDVLIQCFERRCLTYTPGNDEGWEVESGNIGQHYYHWRYHEIPAEPVVAISLEPQVAENPLYIFDLELLEIDPDDPGEQALFAIVGIDPTDDPIVLTPEQTENILTLFAIFFGTIQMVDPEDLTADQMAILAAFEEETGIDLLEVDFPFEEDRPAAVTLLIQLETEGPVVLDDLDPDTAGMLVLFVEWITGINLDEVDLAAINQHTVTATVTENNAGVEGVVVQFQVNGEEAPGGEADPPHNGTHFGVTDTNGNVSFTYMAAAPGQDTITATIVDTGVQATANKTWSLVAAPGFPMLELTDPSLTLEPEEATNPVGTEHTVTATLLDDGQPVEGAFLFFAIEEGPHATFTFGYTDEAGQATFTYTGTEAGEDQILAGLEYVDAEGEIQFLEAGPVTKSWISGE
jgi:hypothetical protein